MPEAFIEHQIGEKPMSINNYLEIQLKRVNEHMDQMMYGKSKMINQMVRWVLDVKGKQLRPRFMLASAYSLNPDKDITEFAAMLELIHMATLIHDDVIDNSEKRRNRLSVQKKFGIKSAVYLGDYMMFSMIYNFNNQQELMREYSKTILERFEELCYGELNQNEKLYDLSITKEEHLANIQGKTAALFEVATMAGAIMCESEDQVINEYAKIGRNFGMLFQIHDDLLDILSDEKIIGKPTFQDFYNGVYTLPIILAKEEKKDYKIIQKLANDVKKDGMTKEYRTALLSKLIETNSFARACDIAKGYYDEGMEAISVMPNEEVREYFRENYNQLFEKICEMCEKKSN